jgi:hypothetical protein
MYGAHLTNAVARYQGAQGVYDTISDSVSCHTRPSKNVYPSQAGAAFLNP